MINEEFSDFTVVESEEINKHEPEEKKITITVEEKEIIEALLACINISPKIKSSQILVNTCFLILKSIFINNKPVIINAPTGSGKTIIGFMINFCSTYIYRKHNGLNPNLYPEKMMSYYLTSSKVLQEQISNDIENFELYGYLSILKGVVNYPCLFEDNKYVDLECKLRNVSVADFKRSKDYHFKTYSERACLGLKLNEIAERFECLSDCPYKNARAEAAEKNCAVLNYAYFLTTRRDFNPFFGTRFLTICDEAHLIPDIVCNLFSWDFNQRLQYQTIKFFQKLSEADYNNLVIRDIWISTIELNFFFRQSINRVSEILTYVELLKKWYKIISETKQKYFSREEDGQRTNKVYDEFLEAELLKLLEHYKALLFECEDLVKLINERPEDIFYESVEVSGKSDESMGTSYKHIIRDLNEAELVKKHFLTKCDNLVFMSATLGNPHEFAKLIGLEPDTYDAYSLPSTFDFEKSPVYVCNSGYLTWKNFDSNIDKVLTDCIKICDTFHSKEKGIIHTSTFKIAELLQKKVNLCSPNYERYCFYHTAKEKEELIEKLKVTQKPLILIGPSLYEGIDLKNDLGRFNILIKVPYSGLSDYVKKKLERFPFWYERDVLQKIVQAIGRTNRHTNDYSTIYLLDTKFNDLIYKIDDDAFISRIRTKRL